MSDQASTELYFADALLPGGWAGNVRVTIDGSGDIAAVQADVPVHKATSTRIDAIAIPGMPNMHSHAFQRAMAGLTEVRCQKQESDDDFWSWRLVMYDFVERLDPEILEAIAAQLYVEMLKAGYTSVGEFHYLHHDRGGARYGDIAEMSRAILRASHDAGIGLTLLPVFYMTGGFELGELEGSQKRFYNNLDSFGELMEALAPAFSEDHDRQLGVAFHSLRAVPASAMGDILSGPGYGLPVHIHIAEQRREVVDCVRHLGARPVAWLLDNAPVDGRWCLVHATHTDDAERHNLARAGASICLCPTTEANLGDGLFPAGDWLEAGGKISIGSDSNVSVDPREELRLLEYGQRLARERRTVLAAADDSHTGARLYKAALAGGAQASGRSIGKIAAGERADIVVLDAGSATLTGRAGDEILDSLVFTGGPSPVRDVMVGGKWVIKDGHHRGEAQILADYRAAVGKLRESE